jgi:TIR domain
MTPGMSTSTRDHIFISYRRDDGRGASGRLYDWLRIGFGREHVFRDVHSIGVGKRREKIDAALARSAVCVAVIGPRWANADNLARLQDEADMVRHELVTALASEDLKLVPTLVEGAEVPKVPDLPAVLRPLFEAWNARRVTEDGWEDDTRRLIADERHLQRVLDEYVAYFNAWRPHQGLGQRAPCGSAPTAPSNPTGRIIGQPVLGGLHHVYHHAA